MRILTEEAKAEADMRNDLDPGKTWKDAISPTSPSNQDGGAVVPITRQGPLKSTTRAVDMEKQVASFSDAPATQSKQQGSPTYAATVLNQTPAPLPPVYDPRTTVAKSIARRRNLDSPPSDIQTASTTPTTPTASTPTLSQKHSASTPPTPHYTSIPSTEFAARTPTPTSAQFREMLSTYDIPEDEVSRMYEMVEKIQQSKVRAARQEERESAMRSAGSISATTGGLRTGGFLSPGTGVGLRVPSGSGLLSPSSTQASTLSISATSPSLRSEGGIGSPPLSHLRPSSRISERAAETDVLTLKILVLQRLLPAKKLLRSTDGMPRPETARAAAEHAYSALQLAKRTVIPSDEIFFEGESTVGIEHEVDILALRGLCSYYVGVAEWILSERDSRGLPLSLRYEDKVLDAAPVRDYFEQARDAAKDGYREGRWAEDFVQYFRTMQKMADQDEKGSGEMDGVGLIARTIRLLLLGSSPRNSGGGRSTPAKTTLQSGRSGSEKKGSSKQTARHERVDSVISPDTQSPENQRAIKWQPLAFLSTNGSAAGMTNDAVSPAAHGTTKTRVDSYFTVNGLANMLQEEPLLPLAEPTLPKPATDASHSRKRSLHFREPGSLPSSRHSSPDRKSIYARRVVSLSPFDSTGHARKPSLLARVTGRERRRSEVEAAEEGDSPFREGFQEKQEGTEVNGKDKGREGSVRRRKHASPPEEMV